jgi:hypothetical protein
VPPSIGVIGADAAPRIGGERNQSASFSVRERTVEGERGARVPRSRGLRGWAWNGVGRKIDALQAVEE